MDSCLIYIVDERLMNKVSWTFVTNETEWIYFGAADEADCNIAIKNIDVHFEDSTLYVCLTRQNSFEVHKENILEIIKDFAGYENFKIWNSSFDHVIEFAKIGVLRCGKVYS